MKQKIRLKAPGFVDGVTKTLLILLAALVLAAVMFGFESLMTVLTGLFY